MTQQYKHKRTGNIYELVGKCLTKVESDGGVYRWLNAVVYRSGKGLFCRLAHDFEDAFEPITDDENRERSADDKVRLEEERAALAAEKASLAHLGDRVTWSKS